MKTRQVLISTNWIQKGFEHPVHKRIQTVLKTTANHIHNQPSYWTCRNHDFGSSVQSSKFLSSYFLPPNIVLHLWIWILGWIWASHIYNFKLSGFFFPFPLHSSTILQVSSANWVMFLSYLIIRNIKDHVIYGAVWKEPSIPFLMQNALWNIWLKWIASSYLSLPSRHRELFGEKFWNDSKERQISDFSLPPNNLFQITKGKLTMIPCFMLNPKLERMARGKQATVIISKDSFIISHPESSYKGKWV